MEFVVVFAMESVKLWEGTTQFIQGLVLPVEVIATVVIAAFTVALFALQFLQHRHEKKVSRANYALALYEKRLEVYVEVKEFLSAFSRSGMVSRGSVMSIRHSCGNARFLFPEQTREYLDQLFTKSSDLGSLRKISERLRAPLDEGETLSPEVTKELEKTQNQILEIQEWPLDGYLRKRFENQFDPYLKLPESL